MANIHSDEGGRINVIFPAKVVDCEGCPRRNKVTKFVILINDLVKTWLKEFAILTSMQLW